MTSSNANEMYDLESVGGGEDYVNFELQPTQIPLNCSFGGNSSHSFARPDQQILSDAQIALTTVQYLYENHIIHWPNFTNCLPNCGICGSVASENDYTYTVFNLLIIGLLLPFVSLCGLLGNGLSSFVYSRPSMRTSSNNLYLCALGCSDNAVVFTAIFLFFVDSVRRYSITLSVMYARISQFIYPAGMIAQTCSVYFTLVAGIDCFVHVCLPNGQIKKSCSNLRCVRWTIFSVVCFGIIYNAPHFFEAILLECWHPQFETESYEVCPAPFRFHPTYTLVYIKYMYSIFLAVGPLLLLVVLNSCIILATVVFKKQPATEEETEPAGDDNFALILVASLSNALGWRINYIIDTSNLLVVFNSSFNFVIYYNFSKAFKTTFQQYFCRKKCSFSSYSTNTLLPSPLKGRGVSNGAKQTIKKLSKMPLVIEDEEPAKSRRKRLLTKFESNPQIEVNLICQCLPP
uniref:G-protein coupled receptors family 1 profile domain-containing protein n=1 Tax=Ditylenchus dipsaci TaxID=166011 RepID=A0A915DN72_9BILA